MSISTDKSVSVDGWDLDLGQLSRDDTTGKLAVDTDTARATFRSEEGERNYTLANAHFHAPGEHAIEGRLADLEIHSVFRRLGRTYADYLVVGVMFDLDIDAPDDPFLTQIDASQATATGYYSIINVPFKDFYSWASPKEKFNYQGSLTTPTCTEDVEWFVVKDLSLIHI